MSDYQIADGRAIPTSPLAVAIHANLLRATARATSSSLVDKTRAVGRVRMGWTFEGPDVAGWYSGKVSYDPDSLEFTFPAPDPADPADPADPLGILRITPSDTPIRVAVAVSGDVIYRCKPFGTDLEWTGTHLPDFDVRAFSPILRERSRAGEEG